jgi:hypothetical protein
MPDRWFYTGRVNSRHMQCSKLPHSMTSSARPSSGSGTVIAEDPCCIIYDPSFSRSLRDVGRVDEHRNNGGWRHQVVHQLKAFCDQLHINNRNACDVATGPCEAWDETNFDWVGTDLKDDRDCLGRGLGSQRSWCTTPNNDHGHPTANQIHSQCRQPIVVPLCPSVFDCYVAALGKSCIGQASVKCGDIPAHHFNRRTAENPIVGIAGCCACAASGHAAAVPPSSAMTSRRLNRVDCICCPSQELRGIIPDC